MFKDFFMPFNPFVKNVIDTKISAVMSDVSNKDGKIDDRNFNSMITGITTIKDNSLSAEEYQSLFSALKSVTSTMEKHDELKSAKFKIMGDIISQLPLKLTDEFYKSQKMEELFDMHSFVREQGEQRWSDLENDKIELSKLANSIPESHKYLQEDIISIAKGENENPSHRLALHNLSVQDAVIFQKYYTASDIARRLYTNSVDLQDVNTITSKPEHLFQSNIAINDTHTEVYYSPDQKFLVKTATRLGYAERKLQEREIDAKLERIDLLDIPEDIPVLKDIKVDHPSSQVFAKSSEESLPATQTTSDIDKSNSSQKSSDEMKDKSGGYYDGLGHDLMRDVRNVVNKYVSDKNKENGKAILSYSHHVGDLLNYCNNNPQNSSDTAIIAKFSTDFFHTVNSLVENRDVDHNLALKLISTHEKDGVPSLLQSAATFFREHKGDTADAGYIYPMTIVNIASKYPHQKSDWRFQPSPEAKLYKNSKEYHRMELGATNGILQDKTDLELSKSLIQKEKNL